MIYLYADNTSSSYKATIALEELGAAYQLEHIRTRENEHHEASFLARHPAGRVPLLIDDQTGAHVFESSMILLYLAVSYQQLLPRKSAQRWEAISWLSLASAETEPMLAQWSQARELPQSVRSLPHESIARRLDEMDTKLSGQAYLVGETYSVVDIANFVLTHDLQQMGYDFGHFRHLSAWHQRMALRPAVQRGISAPMPAFAR